MDEIFNKLSPELQKRIVDAVGEAYENELISKGFKGPLPSEIIKERKTIETAIESWGKAKKALQERCNHVNSTYEYQGSSGNWDRDESYWYSWNCSDCGKSWHTPQTLESRKKYPYAVEKKK